MISTLHRRVALLAGLAVLTALVGLLAGSGPSARAAGTSGSAVTPAGVTQIGTAVAYVKDADGSVHPYRH